MTVGQALLNCTPALVAQWVMLPKADTISSSADGAVGSHRTAQAMGLLVRFLKDLYCTGNTN